MTGLRLQDAADHHISVPDRLDLLKAGVVGKFVKSEKYLVQFGNQLL